MDLIQHEQLIKQGAEARVYKVSELYPVPTTRWTSKLARERASIPSSSQPNLKSPAPLLIKQRFPKQYRHPTLDAQLTKSRLTSEARSLLRCLKAGVVVPAVRMMDVEAGILGLEWIDGWSVREVLGGGAEGEEGYEEVTADVAEDETTSYQEDRTEAERALEDLQISEEDLMTAIGSALAGMHAKDIIHGDLTTSNMMLRPRPGEVPHYEIVLIDFGLSSNSPLAENLAVDLYVLERAFGSTHPSSEGLFAKVLEAYGRGLGAKRWKVVHTRLEEVRLRGRKRDMTG